MACSTTIFFSFRSSQNGDYNDACTLAGKTPGNYSSDYTLEQNEEGSLPLLVFVSRKNVVSVNSADYIKQFEHPVVPRSGG